jgi:Domain of unknown function (DUF4412)
MKNFILLFLLLVAIDGQTQTFEGTMHWTMNLEITDPEMKAKMEQAQRQLNDPETQAEIAAMKEKMNDPEMKKMMDQNPQMKAAMENAMKSFNNNPGGMDNMMPKGMTVKIKSGSMVTLMEGGMADGMEMLHKPGQTPVRINRVDKTYSKMPEASPSATKPDVTVNKMGETLKVLGYTCSKYVVQMNQEGKQVKQVVWATSEIKDIDLKSLAGQQIGQGQTMFSDKIEGVPLKIEVASPQGNMVMEVVDIKREKLKDGDFVIPAGFKEVKTGY